MLKCNTVYLTQYRSMRIPVSFRTAYARADKQILVDSGATDNFIHPRLIRQLGLGTQHLPRERKIWNIDGTANKAGMISEFVDLCVTIRTYRPIFIYFIRCTDTGVIVTHALSFYRPLAPLFLLTHAQLAVVTQSCALLYIAAHCDLLLQ